MTGFRNHAVRIALLALVAGSCGTKQDDRLDRAAAALARGGPALAVADSLYRDVLERQPENEEARYGAGVAEVESGRTWAGLWQLTRLLRTAPDHAGALARLGLTAYSQGRLDDAIPLLERLRGVRPLGYDESVALADACNKRNRYVEAEELFVSVLDRFPDDTRHPAKVLEGLGYARWKQGRLEEAATDHARALAIAPERPGVRVAYATILADLGRPSEALAALPSLSFDEARQAGLLGDYFVLRSRLLLVTGSPEELAAAERELERVLEEVRDQVKVPFVLAQVRRKLGDLEGAREAVAVHRRMILDLDRREDSRAEQALAEGATHEGEGDVEGALELYLRGVEIAPENTNLRCAAGGALALLGRREEARRHFAQLREQYGGPPGILFQHTGTELRRRGLARAAARQYELAASRMPGNEEVVYLCALAWTEAGDWDAAIEAAAPLDQPLPASQP